MRGLIVRLLLLWCCLAAASGGAMAGERFALIIGNSDYRHVQGLANPVADASEVADTLSRLGFRVLRGLNLDLAQFKALIADFGRMAAETDTVVFYYAGHGFQLNHLNYLVPVDATLTDRAQIPAQTIRLNDIIFVLGARAQQTVIFLDACRDNPLPLGVRDRDSQQGLASVEKKIDKETFVAFATQPDNVASDGADRHSPFTTALLTHLARPRLGLAEMMIDVRKDVFTDTQGRQVPWDQSSLREQFYFNPVPSVTERIAALPPPQEPQPVRREAPQEPPAPPPAQQRQSEPVKPQEPPVPSPAPPEPQVAVEAPDEAPTPPPPVQARPDPRPKASPAKPEAKPASHTKKPESKVAVARVPERTIAARRKAEPEPKQAPAQAAGLYALNRKVCIDDFGAWKRKLEKVAPKAYFALAITPHVPGFVQSCSYYPGRTRAAAVAEALHACRTKASRLSGRRMPAKTCRVIETGP